MAIKVYKPTTPGRRGMSVVDYSELSKVAPEKSLLAPKNKKAGRNSYVVSPSVIAAAATARSTELSISNAVMRVLWVP